MTLTPPPLVLSLGRGRVLAAQYFDIALPFLLALFKHEPTRLPSLGLLDRLGARLGPAQTRQLLLKPIVNLFEVIDRSWSALCG